MAGDAESGNAGGGLSDALRSAVEKTFAAAADPRDRAQELLGDIGRRGQAPREAAAKLSEIVEGLRQVKDLEARVKALEEDVRRLEQARSAGDPKPHVEG